MSLARGTRLGPYEVVSSLGAGGMGEVYRALDTRLERHVAIKVLPGATSDDPMARERFKREARTVSALAHRSICPLFDIGEQDGRAYLVMECLEGETLASVLKRGSLPINRALVIAADVADAMSYAHAAGVIHRDLKPGNVMLLPDGSVKVLDFGLARRTAGASDATIAALSETGSTSGTVAYMSPEQTMGHRVDHRSDLFSLGVMLYEMLSGTRPFDGKSVFSVMQDVVSRVVAPIDTKRADVPPDVARFLDRLMAKSPDDRPSATSEVTNFLRSAAAAQGANVVSSAWSTPSVPTTQPRAGLRYSPWVWAGGVALVVGAIAIMPLMRTALGGRASALPGRPDSASSADSGASPRSAPEWIRVGRELLHRYDQKGNRDKAIEAFRHAVEVDATSAAAYAGLADAFLSKDGLTPDVQWVRQATEAATRALELNPDLALGHASMGAAQLRAKQPDEARKSIDRALDLDPRNVAALLSLGDYYRAKSDLAQAEAAYHRAVAVDGNNWVTHSTLGQSFYAQAKYDAAASTWEEADRKATDNVLVLRNLGAAYHMIGRRDEAASALQRALAIEPTAGVYNNLGTIRFFQGRYSEAAAAFEKAIEINPTFYLYWASLGDAYRWVPDGSAKAREAYSRAVSLLAEDVKSKPADPDVRTRLALYLAKQGESETARQELERWRRLTQKTAASHFRALVAYEIVGERDRALASLDAALKAGYAAVEVQNEPELIKLRTDPRYHRIVAAVETGTTRSTPQR